MVSTSTWKVILLWKLTIKKITTWFWDMHWHITLKRLYGTVQVRFADSTLSQGVQKLRKLQLSPISEVCL